MYNRIWASCDWHLWNKENTSKHPYRSISYINHLAENYRKDIKPGDLWLYLGDLCDPEVAQVPKLREIISSIPGYKVMCRGNKDTETDDFYLNLGFDVICDVCKIGVIVFSHKPVKIDPDQINIHGHLHSMTMSTGDYQHINVYCDAADNHPTSLDDVLDRALKQGGEQVLAGIDQYFNSLDNYTQYRDILDLTNEYQITESTTTPMNEILFPDIASTGAWEQDDDYEPGKKKKEPMADGEGSLDESASLVSRFSPGYKPHGKKSLTSFKKYVCDEGSFEKWYEKFRSELKHVRVNSNCFITLWIDEEHQRTLTEHLVAYICIEQRGNNHVIQALEVLPEYRGYGLSKQLMKYAKINDADVLYVDPDNKVAIKLYQDCGWKFGEDKNRGKLQPMFLGENAMRPNPPYFNKPVIYLSRESLNHDPVVCGKPFAEDLSSAVANTHKQDRNGEYYIVSPEPGYLDMRYSVECPNSWWSPDDVIAVTVGKMRFTSPTDYEIIEIANDDGTVTKLNEAAIKFVNDKGDVNEIQALEILPDYQSCGLGKQLMKYAKINGANLLYVDPANNVAKKLYNDSGWKMAKWRNRGKLQPMVLAESASDTVKLYHLSQQNLNGKTLQPSVPSNYFTKNGYEDATTKRVCFAPGIKYCLRALNQKCADMELYVHIPIEEYDIVHPTLSDVPDVKITKETWITSQVKVQCIGKIKIIGDAGEDGFKFSYGNKTAELYDWDYKWIEKPNTKSLTEAAINENFILSGKDLVFNIDKWKPEKGHNILFVTGLSGSGKSTLAREYATKYHAVAFEMDSIEGNIKDKTGILDQVAKECPAYQKYLELKDSDQIKGNEEDCYKGLIAAIDKSVAIMKKNYNTLYVCEGVQIYDGGVLTQDSTNYPLIIKNTSMLTSIIRSAKRTKKDFSEDMTSKEMLQYILTRLKNAPIHHKSFTTYVRARKLDHNISESAINFVDDKGNPVPKVCPKCGAKVGVFLKGEPVFLCSNKKCGKYFGTVPFNETADAVVDTSENYLEPDTDSSPFGDDKRFFSHIKDFRDDYTLITESSYQFELEDHSLRFFDTIDESATNDTKLYPVYVMLIHSGSLLSNAIKTVTNSKFSHSVISFDSTFRNMYSFGRKRNANPFIGAFIKEDIKSKFYQDHPIPYAIYVVPCTAAQIAAMKKRLDYFIRNSTKFKYDFTGLFKNYFGIADNPEYKWFCSRFVADILNAGSPSDHPFIIEPSLMKPEDFRYTTFATYVTGGESLSMYEQTYTDKQTKRILRAEQIRRTRIRVGEKLAAMEELPLAESVICNLDRRDPMQEKAISYQLSMLDEASIDGFLQYLQSFKLHFNKQGDIIISRREYDQLDQYAKRSIKMLRTYEKAGNMAGVKDELCRVRYMILLIDQNYLSPKAQSSTRTNADLVKQMTDLRSVLLNVFQQYLRKVTEIDPQYNFEKSYNASIYGKDTKIPKAVLTALGKTVLTKLT